MVVVEDDEQIAATRRGIVHGLKGHTRAQRPVTNDGHDAAAFALELGGLGHSKRRRDTGGGMRRAKCVVLALLPPRKAANPPLLAQTAHAVGPAGEDFVGIRLVAHVPDQPVMGGFIDMVQGHGQLDSAQVGTQVPPGLGHRLQHKGAQGLRHRL